VKVISGVYHQRIDYPQTRHLTEPPSGSSETQRREGARLERSF